ncbi:MAG: NADH-quinone oxidoreductase subunit NuoE [Candidatus Margulisiibacteriota bacterium]
MPSFSPEALAQIQTHISHYPPGKQKSAILPVLHIAQVEFGWLSVETMNEVAKLLEIQPIEVYEVATFYTMYHLKPTGTYVFEVCQTGPCCLIGAERIIGYLEKKLGIKVGETTSDGLFTLKVTECLASCSTGPVMQLGHNYVENLTETKVDELIESLKEQAKLNPKQPQQGTSIHG